MAERFVQRAWVALSATVTLDEDELAALEALAGYDIDSFLRAFYERMGRAYLEPHEPGLRSLFKTAREEIPGLLRRARVAREAFVDKPASRTPSAPSGEEQKQ